MYTQPVAAITNPRTSCPHLEALVPFETRFSGQIVNGAVLTLSSTDALLLSGCSIPANVILSRIEIVAGAKLVFNDQDISFSIGEISIASGGSLHAGSETCRLYSKISIQFVGSKGASSPVVSTATSKGIISSGTLSLHGKQYNPTWTRLAVAAKAGDSTLVLQDPVNWEVGQRILVTTSSFFDCPTKYAQWCAPCKPWELSNNNAKCKIPTYYPHQNEVRTITAISSGGTYRGFAIQLDSPLVYGHYAGLEYQSEVALLSRRINFAGEQTNDNFGGHVMCQGSTALCQISGVAADNMGQLNVLGRYPFHAHLVIDCDYCY